MGSSEQRPVVVVEDDPFPRLIQVILDPATSDARRAAFAHFFAHEVPEFSSWCDRLRARLPRLYPAQVRLVSDAAALLAAMPGANIVVTESLRVGVPEIAAGGASLSVLQKYGTVLSNIDEDACRAAGVRVLTLRRRANIACAEHALAMMLSLARKIPQVDGLLSVEQLRAAGYSPTRYDRSHTANANWGRVTGIRTLYGKQLGIFGLGEIGREVAMRASAFGMRVVYTQRHALAPSDEAHYGASFADPDVLLSMSDVVSIHLPATDATRGIIGARDLARMKPGAMLVNVSRPQLIDRNALLEALRAGRLGSVGLDPYYDAPAKPDDPLLAFENVIVTPHVAAAPRFNALDDFEELLIRVEQALAEKA